MPSAIVTTFLVLTVIVVLLPSEVVAFGAGDIPDFSYLEGKAFRHGDIENTLLELVKAAAHSQGGGLLGFAQNVLSAATGGAKFSKEDVKRVYFGNWLRDYSQAMDIAGLSKLTADTLVLIVGVLGFLEFGFATVEFEVTQDRLGVYLPVEHIDNPRGYAEKEGDARNFHPKLRPPVDSRELELDSRTGMKNYMATENCGWDTSTAFIRRTLRECIQKGRNAGSKEGPELWEAYRLLGQGLHTLEDFTAHSNWVEIALRKLGHNEVFCHVGDNVYVDSPNGRVPPIVTGTFGGADFFHSLLGETTDKISQSSVTDLSAKMSDKNNNALSGLKDILGKLKALGGSDGDSQMNQAEEMKRKSEAYHFNPNQAFPPEVVKNLKEVLKYHDDVMRSIIQKMQMIPGLTDLIDGLSNALNAFVYTTIAPYVAPVLSQATSAIGEGSAAVISSADQWEVFNSPNASDPTHSVLSKDHFGIILNEPAGKVAKAVVEHSVNLIVEAWSNNSNPDDVINRILEAFHHPYYNNGRSEIQNKMIEVVDKWLGGMGHSKAQETIGCLTKEAVRQGRNKRQGEDSEGHGCGGGYSGGYSTGRQTGGSYDGGSTKQSYNSGGYQQTESKYGGGSGGKEYGGGSYGRSDDNSYGNKQSSHGRSDDRSHGSTQSSYGRSDDNNYGGKQTSYGRSDSSTYGQKQTSHGRSDDNSYGNTQSGYGRSEDTYGGKKQAYGQSDDTSYGNTQSGYGRSDDTYGGDRSGRGGSSNKSYETTQSSYGRSDETYGGNRGRRDDDSDANKQSNYGRSDNSSYEKTQSGYGRSDDSYGGGRGGYGRSDDSSYNRSSDTYGGGSTRQRESDDNSYGSVQRSYGGSGDNYNTGSYGKQDERGSGHGSSGYSSKRTDDDGSHNTSGYRSGYQPSYQSALPPGNTSSGNTHSSGGGYGGGRQTETGYNTSGGYGGGNSYGSDDRGSYGGGGQHGEGQSKKSHHKKHHDDDDETYGAERLNLRDDDDDKHRRGHGGESYGQSGGYGSRRYGGDDY